MSAPSVTNADMLEIQLRKWIGKRHVHNVNLNPACSVSSVPEGEKVIAEVIDRSGQGLFFTGNGFVLPGHGFIHYDNITAAEWISSESFEVRAKRKREHFDHIEFAFRDGSSATLSDVQQAVFPLLHFFEWMILKRKHTD